MPCFFFIVTDHEGASGGDQPMAFDSSIEAAEQARTALAEMALDGLPTEPLNMYRIELLDSDRRPLMEFRLVYEQVSRSGEHNSGDRSEK